MPQMFPMWVMLTWAGQVGFWFMLFWSFLPLALAAFELNQLNQRYV